MRLFEEYANQIVKKRQKSKVKGDLRAKYFERIKISHKAYFYSKNKL